ncbi:MAG: hypothetical protein IKM11_03980 [Oscillospiraceae bacterium]|nr:hypothetical protein [Oscillospiraceae bacterium]
MPSIGNVPNYYGMQGNTSMINSTAKGSYTNSTTDAYGLDMSDFMSLMVAQFTNQSIDATADISDMLNQLVQMQMVTALSSMSTAMNTMTDASIMTYAASLVGKEVTVAGFDEEGNYQEVIGNVTATGSYGGEQVIFVDDVMYYMDQIIAVGRLPEAASGETGKTDEETSGNQNSGTTPGVNPGTTPGGETPGVNPGTTPGGETPGVNPGTTPGGETPGVNPGTTPGEETPNVTPGEGVPTVLPGDTVSGSEQPGVDSGDEIPEEETPRVTPGEGIIPGGGN